MSDDKRQAQLEAEAMYYASNVPREEYNRVMRDMEAQHQAEIVTMRNEHIEAISAMRDQLQTRENMLTMERNAKRAALRRAEAAEMLNSTLVEKLRNLPT